MVSTHIEVAAAVDGDGGGIDHAGGDTVEGERFGEVCGVGPGDLSVGGIGDHQARRLGRGVESDAIGTLERTTELVGWSEERRARRRSRSIRDH